MSTNETKSAKLAFIAGATGGMGSQFAKQLASRQYDLLLADMDLQKLRAFAATVEEEHKVSVHCVEANLTNEASIAKLAVLLTTYDKIDMFVYAAGYGEKRLFKDETPQFSMNMISIHVLAAVQLIHAVLPAMLQRKAGNIIVLSSLASFIPAPGSSIYSASKAFLNVFLESLHMEVRREGVHVQSLCPGLTHTGFHSQQDISRFEGIDGIDLWMEADEVIKNSLDHVGNGTVVCIPGWVNKTIKHAIPAVPRKSYYALAERFAEVNEEKEMNS